MQWVKSVDLGQDREVVLDVSPRNQVEILGIARMQRVELAKALLHRNPPEPGADPRGAHRCAHANEIRRLFAIIAHSTSSG